MAKPCQVAKPCQGHGQGIFKISILKCFFPNSGCSKEAATLCVCCGALGPLWHCLCCESGLIPSEAGNLPGKNAKHQSGLVKDG